MSLPKLAKVFEFKVGDTVMLGCAVLDEDEAPADLTNVTVASQVRDAEDALLCDMEVVPVDLTLGTYELWGPADAEWVAGDFTIDVQYTTPGARQMVRSTETFYLRMLQDVTRP
jgi:hypothetical protein